MQLTRVFAFLALTLPAQPLMAQALDDVVATVEGTDITLGDILAARAKLPSEYQNLPVETLFEGLVSQVIEQELLLKTLDEPTKRMQLLLRAEEREVAASEALSRVADKPIEDAEVDKLYQEQFIEKDMGQEFKASHILVETEEAAQDLVGQLEGGADFAELAREHSTGPSGPSGGDLGWFAKGVMVPAFEEAVLALDVGAVSAPVETQFGWHVIKLEDLRDVEAPSLDQVRAELEQQVRQQRVVSYMEGLLEEADVTRTEGIDPEVVNMMPLLDQE